MGHNYYFPQSQPQQNGFGMMNGQNQGNVLQRFMQFRNSFSGNPQQMVQQLMNSGRVSQDQYNQAVQMANMLSGLFR